MELLSASAMDALTEQLKVIKKERKRITYDEYVELVKKSPVDNPYLINIRGANGTGKSTVPLLMTLTDDSAVFVTNNEGKEILTYSPKYELTIMGRYYTKTGGLDINIYQDKHYIAEVLRSVWADTKTNILMEGIVCSSSYGFYADLFKALQTGPNYRDVLIMNLVMELDDLEKRIMVRNGGRPIKMHYVEGKQATVKRNIKKFERDGFNSWTTNNRDITYSSMVDWYFQELQSNRWEKPNTTGIITG